MSDPLSIAASIAGLITLAGTIHSSLTSFVDRVGNAPQSARTILMEVSIMRMVLTATSDLINQFMELPSARRAMVQLDCLILTVTHAVIAFSDLETFLSAWPAIEKMSYSPLQKIRWSLQDDRAQRLIEKLRDTRIGLSLVLNIFQCVSDFGAMQARDKLQVTVDRLLQENQDLRISLLGDPSIRLNADTVRDSIRAESHHIPARVASVTRSRRTSLRFSQPFEAILNSTKVYSRVRNTECDVSLYTDLVGSHLGSTYTGITLDRISVISVIALPLSWSSIINTQWYKPTFSDQVEDLTPDEAYESQDTDSCSTKNLVYHKIVILGEPAAGKSALAMRFCHDVFPEGFNDPTIEDTFHKTVTLDDKIHELLIVDTAGAQEYDELRRDAIKDAHGIIIVYSIQKAREFSRVEEIHGTLEEMYQQWNMPPIVLVGTGIDRESSRAIPFMQGLNMARKLGCGFCECSSRDGRNVEEPFMQIIRQLQTPVDKNPEMSQKDTSPGMKLLGWEHV